MRRVTLLVAVLLLALYAGAGVSAADEGWTVTDFGAHYQLQPDGSVDVTEDIRVDFGELDKHGIFRYIPVEYAYDSDHKRRIDIDVVSVDDGQQAHKYSTSRQGANLVLKIGDPDRLISGAQRYRLRYVVTGALNPQETTDEFYWNVTGNDWPVTIALATARVDAPAAVQQAACFQGPLGFNRACFGAPQETTAAFRSQGALSEGSGMTIVASLPKGVVATPIELVEIKSAGEQVRDLIGLSPAPIALAGLVGVVSFGGVLGYWWRGGRDRWYGDVQYLTESTQEQRRPFMARETTVVEYEPPKIGDRALRPAEIGTLMDERADTLDVSATIVDLAVRGYLRITEIPKTWLFGNTDYELQRLKPADAGLLLYEQRLHEGLFEDGESVKMSDLKNKFYDDLAKVKEQLYTQVVKADRMFGGDPNTTRNMHLVAGLLVAGIGVAASVGLGMLGAGIVGVPIVLGGLLLALLAGAMPRRTATGRELYRRTLGFREYMVVAETDRQRFNEDENIFQAYLPYAIVFGVVQQWAKRFEDLGIQPSTSSWYVSNAAFSAVAFSHNVSSFSSSISSAIVSTPGGSGGSGFSGGFSGGGGGGGGGGSW